MKNTNSLAHTKRNCKYMEPQRQCGGEVFFPE